MGKVSIVKTGEGIRNALIRALGLIGGLAQFIGHGDVVLLKPNVNGTEAITNIALVEALINLLQEFGVKKVMIAESTFGDGEMTDMCFRQTGYKALAERYGIGLLNLNRSEIVEVKVENPLILDTLKVAREVFEADKIINLPVMKVHYATAVTLSMKNLKGLLVRNEKRHFHEVGLDKAIVDLNNTIKPVLNIVDCTACMERMGPKGGDIVNLNLLMAGKDCAEVDYTGSAVMGYSLDEVKHLKYYVEGNGIDLKKVEVVGERIEDIRYAFKKVEMKNVIPKEFKVHNKNACSSCMNAFLLSCQFLNQEIIKDADIYLGTGHEPAAGESRLSIAFGNCCSREKRFDNVVKGCPPYPFILKKLLEGSN